MKPAKGLAAGAAAGGAAAENGFGVAAADAGVAPKLNAGADVADVSGFPFESVVPDDGLSSARASVVVDLTAPNVNVPDAAFDSVAVWALAPNVNELDVEGATSAGAFVASNRSRSALSSGSSENSTAERASRPLRGPRRDNPLRGGFRVIALNVTRDGIFGKFLNASTLPCRNTRPKASVGVARASDARSMTRALASNRVSSASPPIRRRCVARASLASSSASLRRLRFELGHGASFPSTSPLSIVRCVTETSSAEFPRARFVSPPAIDGDARPLDGSTRARFNPTARAALRGTSRTLRASSETFGLDARANEVDKRLGASVARGALAGVSRAPDPPASVRTAARTRRTESMVTTRARECGTGDGRRSRAKKPRASRRRPRRRARA